MTTLKAGHFTPLTDEKTQALEGTCQPPKQPKSPAGVGVQMHLSSSSALPTLPFLGTSLLWTRTPPGVQDPKVSSQPDVVFLFLIANCSHPGAGGDKARYSSF
jgi:hypothetical protein